MLKQLLNWMTRYIGKHFSVITIILVLLAACSYLGIKAEDLYNWYEGDTVKLIVILIIGSFVASLIGFYFLDNHLRNIKDVVTENKNILTAVDAKENNINRDADDINNKIDTIIRQIGDSSAAVILLVRMSIQAVPQNISLAVEPYLEMDTLSNLQLQSLAEKFEGVKKALFIEISYFIKRFYGATLRTVVVNEPIKIAMRDAFEKCHQEVKAVLNTGGKTASDKMAEVNQCSYRLVKSLFRSILNEEYDIVTAKHMEGAATIARGS